MQRRLYRSEENEVISGVCGGLGEYFDVDPVLVRVIAVLLLFGTGGAAFIAYVVGWIIIPKRDIIITSSSEPVSPEPAVTDLENTKSGNRRSYWPGLILIFIGVVLLVREHWYWIDFDEIWPAALIIIGIALIFGRRKAHSVSKAKSAESVQVDPNGGGAVS